MKRSMIILKMRSTKHDESLIEFKILSDEGRGEADEGTGIMITGTFEQYVGIITGVAQKTSRAFEASEAGISRQQKASKARRLARFEADEREIERKETEEHHERKKIFDSKKRNLGKKQARGTKRKRE